MPNDLVLRFLQLHQLAKLVGLARLPLANDLRLRLKYADQLPRKLGHAFEDPFLGRTGLLPIYRMSCCGHGCSG